ncbi:PIN domain-containing protein [Pseudoduganella namucuonensis]|uniref:PIN domain-containing protein n=1 Tax=Pseudoduganella namucuonensis TaxID=1035707 RepID=UPI000B866FEA|nr:PIN domain-containing protein [Pseudoduganella namucuonensis]
MALALFDTNIIIDALNNHREAIEEMANYQDAAISVITWMEAAAKMTPAEMMEFDLLLANYPIEIIHTDDLIARAAAAIRGASLQRRPYIPLPDAIIGATANVTGRTIITRNPRDFGASQVHVPYTMHNGVIADVLPPPP